MVWSPLYIYAAIVLSHLYHAKQHAYSTRATQWEPHWPVFRQWLQTEFFRDITDTVLVLCGEGVPRDYKRGSLLMWGHFLSSNTHKDQTETQTSTGEKYHCSCSHYSTQVTEWQTSASVSLTVTQHTSPKWQKEIREKALLRLHAHICTCNLPTTDKTKTIWYSSRFHTCVLFQSPWCFMAFIFLKVTV